MDFLTEMSRSNEDEKRMRDLEQLRRKGHKFFKVYMRGEIKRVHSVKDIILIEEQTIDGSIKYNQKEGDRILEGKFNGSTGEYESWLWDDPDEYNRYWLARNKKAIDIEIVDEKIAKAIELLESKEYKIPQNRKEEVKVELRKLEREMRELEKEEQRIIEEEEKSKEKKFTKRDMTTKEIRPKAEKPKTPEFVQPALENAEEGI